MPNRTFESTLSTLEQAGIHLPNDALELFAQQSMLAPISIRLSLGNEELITLNFNIEDYQEPLPVVSQTIGATVTALLEHLDQLKKLKMYNHPELDFMSNLSPSEHGAHIQEIVKTN